MLWYLTIIFNNSSNVTLRAGLYWLCKCVSFRSLLQQLQSLQAVVAGKVPRSCRMTGTQTSTCLMVRSPCVLSLPCCMNIVIPPSVKLIFIYRCVCEWGGVRQTQAQMKAWLYIVCAECLFFSVIYSGSGVVFLSVLGEFLSRPESLFFNHKNRSGQRHFHTWDIHYYR